MSALWRRLPPTGLWGLALVGLGAAALGVATVAAAGAPNGSAAWLIASATSFAIISPLIGLGLALSLVASNRALVAVALFVSGLFVGLVAPRPFLWLLGLLPNAANHQFFEGPISLLLAGGALIVPQRARLLILPVAAAAIGLLFALAVQLTDPSFQDPAVRWVGAVAGPWLVAAVGLTASGFLQPWFPVAGRIVGSWLLTAGLLYGGVALTVRAPAPVPAAPQSGDMDGAALFDMLLPPDGKGAGYGSQSVPAPVR